MLKKFLALLTTVVLLLVMNTGVFAADTSGIRIDMRYQGRPIPGGSLTLHRVGERVEENGTLSFKLTDDFSESRVPLDDVQAPNIAAELAEYAAAQVLPGQTSFIGSSGTVTFSPLEPGLYLILQLQSAPCYYKISPFLIYVPGPESDSYGELVNASPKIESVPYDPPRPSEPEEPDQPPVPDTPPQPDYPDTPDEPSQPPETPPDVPTTPENPGPEEDIPDSPVPQAPKLPQTGQLNWPVGVLVVTGMALMLIGWLLLHDHKSEDYET